MKTAMQELSISLQIVFGEDIYKHSISKLIKEFEDVERDRLWQSWIASEMRNKKQYPINEDLEMERFIEYYNQTYNQNK